MNAPARHQVWYTIQADTNYAFQLQRGTFASSPVVENTLGPFLLSGLANVKLLRRILLAYGLQAAADFFVAHVASSENVRIGDFGEIVAGRLLENAEDLIRPIEKLQYRESSDWPMKLTDVFCIRIEAERIVSLVFGEAKAGTTAPKRSLGRDAYQQIYKDLEDEEPPILFFTLDRLWNNEDYTTYLQLEEAMYSTTPVPRALRLVLIFDEQSWQETILTDLHDAFESQEIESIDDFLCYVLTSENLKEVITNSYVVAEGIAADG